MAGNLATPELIEYTVIGDTVNLASWLESVIKQHHVDLVLSGSTYEAVRERFSGRKLGDEPIRGKAQPVEVFTIEGPHRARSPSSRPRSVVDSARAWRVLIHARRPLARAGMA
ncbi:MAG: hypothetical protein JST54_09670 [Deltaproteobacteria bacterium]|nr:hypothetical protein [Deltaproteobacteria bacterium]